ncbi:MAG: amidohydrolase family protein [Planctomycetota bacterium]
MQPRILDSHHHLWDYDPQQYPWIPPGTPLEQSYGLNDLVEHSADTGLVGTIAVQARQTLGETEWLLGLAERDPLCKGVVGWVPLQDPSVGEIMGRFHDKPLFKGIRHVIQDEEDPEFMLRPALLDGIKTIASMGLRYDILIFAHQLPNTIKMVDQLPDDMPLVLDHIAKPVITPGTFDEIWAKHFAELAKRPNVLCKLSGMATEVKAESWDDSLLKPYFDHAANCFGVDRLMFGSDWPVALLMTDYKRWVQTVTGAISELSQSEQAQILYQNAASFYGVD